MSNPDYQHLQPLSMHGTTESPSVRFDAKKGVLEIRGRSTTESAGIFYAPLMSWVDRYVELPASTTTLYVDLEYYNTTTSKYLLDMFWKLDEAHKAGVTQVLMKWYYGQDDEDIHGSGQDYAAILTMPFEFIENSN